ncbi:hypothetical protein GBA52_023287 [Prunus armeniaca]|nr:hypothetical protein GBA52_023287 [Prunus armeniaca]
MMESIESTVPPGFRFHPTDEELVGYYLRKKVASQKIDLDVIRDIDLYRIEPWDLQERCRIGYEEQNEWYFFSHKDKKYPTGTRTNRATMAGFWKATGRDKSVYDKTKLIGMRKTLVFYKGRAPNGQKTDWIMHEYRLESEENGPPQASNLIFSLSLSLSLSYTHTHTQTSTEYINGREREAMVNMAWEEGWVVCRAFKKRTSSQNKGIEGWDSSYFYEELNGVSSVVDPTEYMISRQPPSFLAQNFMCKQETEADSLNFMHSDHFVQLPQLESPSLPLISKRPSSMSLISENNIEVEDEPKKVTDWRALDKFVASQLSQEERYEGDGESSFGAHDDSEMALLLLQSSGRDDDQGNKLNGFLNSSPDGDIGICIFEK